MQRNGVVGRQEETAHCLGRLRRYYKLGRSCGPKYCRARRKGTHLWKTATALSLFFKKSVVAVAWLFPCKTAHILKGEGAGEIVPFTLIVCRHQEALVSCQVSCLAPATQSQGQKAKGRASNCPAS